MLLTAILDWIWIIFLKISFYILILSPTSTDFLFLMHVFIIIFKSPLCKALSITIVHEWCYITKLSLHRNRVCEIVCSVKINTSIINELLTSLSDSTRTWSYSLRATRNMMDVTFSKQWIHFLRSDLWPPTSTILKDKESKRLHYWFVTDIKCTTNSCLYCVQYANPLYAWKDMLKCIVQPEHAAWSTLSHNAKTLQLLVCWMQWKQTLELLFDTLLCSS